MNKAEIHYNSEWFKKNGLAAMLTMARAATFQQVIKREDFQKRLEANKDISVLEILYPLLQGYDSVKIEADVELGGTDQKFNMLMGRRVQRYFDQSEQDIITVPIIEGTDGVRKMSKSYGNYIGLEEKPEMMFGKLMSIPDCLVDKYFTLLTDAEPDKEANPYENKKLLAWTIVKDYHGEKSANQARENFAKTFSRKETPEEMPEIKLAGKEIAASDLIIFLKMAQSKNEARRLVEQGGLKIEGKIINGATDILNFSGGETVKVGKYHFFKII
ncbi:tyrosine--tRNA ligase [Patescibacteria group bacterium]|nr:tyrosine--tRNA ligase [Patescibacteria group bacterium]